MKVGILTFHNSYNFGAQLQTLATQSVLQSKGVEPVVINYVDRQKLDYYDRVTQPEQIARHRAFADRYLRLSPEMLTTEEIEAFCLDGLDGILVGSDAVFRLATAYHPRQIFRQLAHKGHMTLQFNNPSVFPPYWLDWRTATRDRSFGKFSIAASSTGTEFFFVSAGFLKRAWRSLRDFDEITVRDDWTRLMVRCLSLGRCRPSISPDPVFALRTVFEVPADERPAADFGRTVLLSGKFPDAWRRAVVDALHQRGFQVANLPNPDGDFGFPEADVALGRPISPLAWYATLAGAGGFIGRRFHAMVSCVANHVPVVNAEPRAKADPLYLAKHKSNDLCRRAGMPQRFRTEQALVAMPAARVIDLLFDPASHLAANQYADAAAERFHQVIERMLHRLADKRRAHRPGLAVAATALS